MFFAVEPLIRAYTRNEMGHYKGSTMSKRDDEDAERRTPGGCVCRDVCAIHCFPIEVNKSSHAGLTVEQIKNSHERTTACQSGAGAGGTGWRAMGRTGGWCLCEV